MGRGGIWGRWWPFYKRKSMERWFGKPFKKIQKLNTKIRNKKVKRLRFSRFAKPFLPCWASLIEKNGVLISALLRLLMYC